MIKKQTANEVEKGFLCLLSKNSVEIKSQFMLCNSQEVKSNLDQQTPFSTPNRIISELVRPPPFGVSTPVRFSLLQNFATLPPHLVLVIQLEIFLRRRGLVCDPAQKS